MTAQTSRDVRKAELLLALVTFVIAGTVLQPVV